MKKQKILVVEDDNNIAKLVQYNFEKAGYSCIVHLNGEEALKFLKKVSVDLIILDIMLPSIDGFEVCKQIKKIETLDHIPIIILTAKGEEIDRIVGFELGADDYVVKPFSPRELILRVKAILKRGKQEKVKKEIVTAGSIVIDIPRHSVFVDNKEIIVTSMEFKLLLTLLQRRGRVQSRDRLLDDVWNFSADVTTRTIDTHIKRLRKKLGKAGELIETVRGLGYKIKDTD